MSEEVKEATVEKVKEAKSKEPKSKEPTFTVDQLVEGKKYRYLKDVLRVVLEKDKGYTIKEVDSKIDAFMKGGK